jgi:phosphopentomutase
MIKRTLEQRRILLFKRIFLIVLDSLGIGAQEDAHLYNDVGAHTIQNILKHKALNIPNLISLGYGNIENIKGLEKTNHPKGVFTKMREASIGKDTMTGHWEMMGLKIKEPFLTFTEKGFPKEIIETLEKRTGHKIVGNKAASGTEIIKEYGEHHLKTGDLIVYTSADSVLQIAMHEDKIPIDRQYEISEIVREIMMKPEWKVGRVITRPFKGKDSESFYRTSNRKDYALKPFDKTALNYLKEEGLDVIALGKIMDIFDGYGITEFKKTTSNEDGMNKLMTTIAKDFKGLCFLNLVDFDAKYGHRRDPIGYANAIEDFDKDLKNVIDLLSDEDLLMITADHGNDPTHHGTDHTREFVPLLVYNKHILNGKKLDIRDTFSDVGATILENFGIKSILNGKSFLNEMITNIKEN